MGYKLKVTQNALDELSQIVNYISNHLDNPKAAYDFLDKVEEYYCRLIDNPRIYQLCDHKDFSEKGYRKAVIKNYVLIYRIDEDKKTVFILHILYGRQDYYSFI